MDKPKLDEIREKLDVFNSEKQDQANIESSGMLIAKKANLVILEASQRPDPTPLWLTLWYEGEVCCLFSDSNLGKSIYGVQIGDSIAKKQKVLYFDFELSDKQFQLRYTDEEKKLFQFSDDFYRVEINGENLQTDDFEDALISDIEKLAVEKNAKILIIDNLTYLCIASEKGDLAGALMMRLMHLKRKYSLSILVLAHTPKRQLSSPITQNDLAGSKKLYNFFDSVFAIGKSAKDNSLRYIKQIKCRAGEFLYDSDNIIICSIEQNDSFLGFTQIELSTEKEHLRERSENDEEALNQEILVLLGQGNSYRQIAKVLNISKSKVGRVAKKEKCPTVPTDSHIGQRDSETAKRDNKQEEIPF